VHRTLGGDAHDVAAPLDFLGQERRASGAVLDAFARHPDRDGWDQGFDLGTHRIVC
jgi:hypothetical protein